MVTNVGHITRLSSRVDIVGAHFLVNSYSLNKELVIVSNLFIILEITSI